MNPDRHAVNHYDYFKNLIGATTTAPKPTASSTTSTTPCSTWMRTTISKPSRPYSRTTSWSMAPGMCARPRARSSGCVRRTSPGALLTIEGELDDISGSGQTRAAHDLCTGLPGKEQRHMEAKGAGHYGIFSGRRWRETVYPVVRAFILEHQTAANRQTAVAPAPAAPQTAVRPSARPSTVAAAPKAAPRTVVKAQAPRGPGSAFRCARPSARRAPSPKPCRRPVPQRLLHRSAAPATRWATQAGKRPWRPRRRQRPPYSPRAKPWQPPRSRRRHPCAQQESGAQQAA